MTRPIVRTVLISGALIAAMAIGSACTGAADTPVKTADPKPAAAAPAPTPEAEADTAPTYDTPKPSDFAMVVKETSREHFGSAGDLVEYKLELVVDSGLTFDPEVTYDLKYKVVGDEDGPNTDTIELTGDSYEKPYEDMASTVTGAKISAKVVSVSEA